LIPFVPNCAALDDWGALCESGNRGEGHSRTLRTPPESPLAGPPGPHSVRWERSSILREWPRDSPSFCRGSRHFWRGSRSGINLRIWRTGRKRTEGLATGEP